MTPEEKGKCLQVKLNIEFLNVFVTQQDRATASKGQL